MAAKRPRRGPTNPAYPRRRELRERAGLGRTLLTLAGGTAALSLIGCDRPPGTTDAATARTAAAEPTTSASATAVGSSSVTASASAAPATQARRLPAEGYRQVSLDGRTTVVYALDLSWRDQPGSVAAEASADLLAVADEGLRASPLFYWPDEAGRARSEAAIAKQLAKLAKRKGLAPFDSVKLIVQDVHTKRIRTAGIPPRHDD